MRPTVQDVMTTDPVAVDETTRIQEIAAVVLDHDIGDVIVQRDGHAAGIVSLGDLAQADDPDAVLADIGDQAPDEWA